MSFQWPDMQYRESACQWAERLTNRHHPRFNFQQGMALYALAYMIDRAAGREISAYSEGVVSYWGRRFFPFNT